MCVLPAFSHQHKVGKVEKLCGGNFTSFSRWRNLPRWCFLFMAKQQGQRLTSKCCSNCATAANHLANKLHL